MTNKLTSGIRVGVLENGEIRKGTIKNVYHEFNIAIVAFEDGKVEKVPLSNLGLLPEEKVQDNREPKEPVEKSEITITPGEFKNIASKVIAKESGKMGPTKGLLILAFTVIIAEIHRALFYDEDNND